MKEQEPKELTKLRELRAEKGLSYPDLAWQIGVNPATVYYWFKGQKSPSRMAKKLINQFLVRENR